MERRGKERTECEIAYRLDGQRTNLLGEVDQVVNGDTLILKWRWFGWKWLC